MKRFALLCAVVVLSCSDDSSNGNNAPNNANNTSNNASNNANNTSNNSNNASNNSNNASNNSNNTNMDAGSDLNLDDMSLEDAGSDLDPVDMGVGTRRGCMSNAECGDGVCVQVSPGADWYACRNTIDPPGDDCSKEGDFPAECCAAAECTDGSGGVCDSSTRFYCGGAAPIETYVCRYDGCDAQNPCGDDELCLPSGIFGEATSRCVHAECIADADCNARAAGQCTALFDPCRGRFSGFTCTYDDSPCRSDEDCTGAGPGIQYCYDSGDDTACGQFFPPA